MKLTSSGRMTMAPRLVLVAIAALLSADHATGQPSHQRLLDWLVPDRPSHPEFTDPLTLDSPNAAARYLRLFAELDPELALGASWTSGDPFVLTYEDPEFTAHGPVTVEELRKRLEGAQPWIRQVIEASRLKQLERRQSADLFVRPFDKADPRHDFNRSARATASVLRADAARLWEAGRHDGAIERHAAIIRIGRQLADDAANITDALVAQTIMELGVDNALECLAVNDDVSTASLATAVEGLKPNDPARVREVWNHTRGEVAKIAEEDLQGDEVGDRLLALLLQTVQAEMLTAQFAQALRKAMADEPAPKEDSPRFFEEVRTAMHSFEWWEPAKLRDVLAEGQRLGDELAEVWCTQRGAELAEALDQRIDEDETLLLSTMLPVPRIAWGGSCRLGVRIAELRKAIVAEADEGETDNQ